MRKAKSYPALQAKTFAEITSAHGFGFFVQSSSWLSRLIWFSLTLSCTVLAVVFTSRIAISFFEPPFYSTDISITSDIDKNVPFPDIVVCDPSPWDFAKAAQQSISAQQMSYIARLLYSEGLSDDLSVYKDLDLEYTELLKRFDNNPVKLLNNVTKSCSQLISFCLIGGSNTNYFGPQCCMKLFQNVEYTQRYKCFSFGGKNVSARQASQTFGITVAATVPAKNFSLDGSSSNASSKLNATIAGSWAILMTGISAAVTDKKSTLYFLTQTRMKLMEPHTYSLLAVEKKITDSSNKDSYFQSSKGGKNLEYTQWLRSM